MRKKLLVALMAGVLGISLLAGCGNDSKKSADSKTITMVWLPNESSEGHKNAREELGRIIEQATGKKVEHKLTTDYAITVETIANNKAALAWLGPQGYVEAHNKNAAVIPVVVPSGPSGTLDDAVYYAWLAVNKGQEGEYKKGDSYVIDNIQGKSFSFVSNTSTSGFKVPSSSIIKQFSNSDKWKNLKAADLMQGGKEKFFQEVMFGGSHQGAAINLLSGKVQVAAFCDEVLNPYVQVVSGKANAVGSVYAVKQGAADPLSKYVGKEYVIIASTPVLNSPIVMNTNILSADEQAKIAAALISKETSNNKQIFVPKGDKFVGMFIKTKDEQFVKVEDSWFEPIRALSK